MTSLEKYNLLIDGKTQVPSREKYFDAVNPSTGEVFAQVADASQEDMGSAITGARRAFDTSGWPQLGVKERGQYLIKIAQLIRQEAKDLALLECLDTGKTIKQTTFIDVPTAADTFEYFGQLSWPLGGCVNPVPDPVESKTLREPVGVVGCIIPWNYPLIMAAWKIAPALITGNTVVLKPSPLASVSVMKLAQWIKAAGLPEGVLNIISSSSHEVSAELVKHPAVDMVSFTGSTRTGREIMRLASESVKKITLELGGKSPNIVFADCDLQTAVGGTLSAIFMNQGQMCTAGSRLLLEDKIYDAFMRELVTRTKNFKIGPAMSYETDFGPLISSEHRKHVLNFIEQGVKEGARLVCGGRIPQEEELRRGFYLEPTIFEGVHNGMSIAREEIFGPVLSVIRFSTVDEAVKIANDSEYGLAACVWTKDLNKAHDVSRRLRCGNVWINTYGGFYNEAPFGGCKQSGFGRELGLEGLLEYTHTKQICTDLTPGGKPLVSAWF
ncbi:MAG: hypothetical protein A2Z81_07045 [Omnitrophica WOR_2 bacterium GWA2_45_18]|nr:MAG: hypothetical protein A2Z81_07045 [Omnitrophica WOR_2 bacterium GWA2_45_18]